MDALLLALHDERMPRQMSDPGSWLGTICNAPTLAIHIHNSRFLIFGSASAFGHATSEADAAPD